MHDIELHRFDDDGSVPNSVFPVLILRAAFVGANESGGQRVEAIERHFERNGWIPDWCDGVYDFHHYHSTAHEALGVASGHGTLMLGGPRGKRVQVAAGDVIVLPAGTGHCSIHLSDDFLVVGAYPAGQNWDVMKGTKTERAGALQRIAQVPTPHADPVTGQPIVSWTIRGTQRTGISLVDEPADPDPTTRCVNAELLR